MVLTLMQTQCDRDTTAVLVMVRNMGGTCMSSKTLSTDNKQCFND
jgi:phosphoribosyl-AMP cyclohydrolase